MLGLSRNTWFGIGGVLLAGALVYGFSGRDEPKADAVEATQASKKKAKHKSKRRDKKRTSQDGSGGLGVTRLCAKLQCDEALESEFKARVHEHRDRTSSDRRAVAEAHAKVAAEFAEATLDGAALDEAFAALADHNAAIAHDARGVLEAMHARLTTPQRETLAKLVARYGPVLLFERPSKRGHRSKRKRGRNKGHGKRRGTNPATADAQPSADDSAVRHDSDVEDAHGDSPVDPPTQDPATVDGSKPDHADTDTSAQPGPPADAEPPADADPPDPASAE